MSIILIVLLYRTRYWLSFEFADWLFCLVYFSCDFVVYLVLLCFVCLLFDWLFWLKIVLCLFDWFAGYLGLFVVYCPMCLWFVLDFGLWCSWCILLWEMFGLCLCLVVVLWLFDLLDCVGAYCWSLLFFGCFAYFIV